MTAGSRRRARLAACVHFSAHGAMTALWILVIPTVRTKVGLSEWTLGVALLALAAGAVLAVQTVGVRLLRRHPPGSLSWICALIAGPALLLPALAGSMTELLLALLPLGAGLGLLDVAMNAHAAEVEAAYERPLMSSFHGVWSLATLVATVAGGAALHADWPLTALLCAGGLVLGGACAAVRRWASTGSGPRPAPPPGPRIRHRLPQRVWILAAMAFGAFICQGSIGDWAGVWLTDTFHVSGGLSALGYGAFALTATAGSFLVDRVVRRFGRVALLRWGGVLAAAGIALAVTASNLPLSIIGWALTGAGCAGIPPQLYSTASKVEPDGGAALAQVSSASYVGSVVGPALIGWLATVSGLSTALLFLVLPALAIAGAAAVCRPEPGEGRNRSSRPPAGLVS